MLQEYKEELQIIPEPIPEAQGELKVQEVTEPAEAVVLLFIHAQARVVAELTGLHLQLEAAARPGQVLAQ